MDVHSSSLLSPIAPAPDVLAEERSAMSQAYSDTRSIDPLPSSLQPLRGPQIESQDATLVSDEFYSDYSDRGQPEGYDQDA